MLVSPPCLPSISMKSGRWGAVPDETITCCAGSTENVVSLFWFATAIRM
jgi:hypothetical protein